jgi:hypothetical protein
MNPEQPFNPDTNFGDYCRMRFSEIMKTDPIFALNKQRMTCVIAEEWKQKFTNVKSQSKLPPEFKPSNFPPSQWSVQLGCCPDLPRSAFQLFVIDVREQLGHQP